MRKGKSRQYGLINNFEVEGFRVTANSHVVALKDFLHVDFIFYIQVFWYVSRRK